MLAGGAARDWWEKRRLLPKVEEIRLSEGSAASEKSRALMLLFTFMVAAGALTGEAFFGVEAAVMAVTDELETEQEYLPDSWTEDTYLDEMIGAPDDDFGHVLGYATSRISSDIMDGKEPSCQILPESVICTETMSIKSWWPQARFAGFLVVNIALAGLIFMLFRAAGIIGVKKQGGGSEVMDAEIAG
tara:strand:- start:880 stop:1443 length:564 start_codon:yes stop_codon:yes gene_type:complete